jgi:L-seryl-tRNA(Ser) seleniumtransferase
VSTSKPTAAQTDQPLRHVPKVDVLLADASFASLLSEHGRRLVTDGIRADLAEARRLLTSPTARGLKAESFLSPAACAERVGGALRRLAAPGYGRALNGTGVILHTGLGRAPLGDAARAALDDAARSFAVLEVEPESGRRGKRDAVLAELLAELTGAEAATVVNNNAAATLICLAALAHGRQVIVSRGQLVEIGGSFRIPDVMALSGAQMVEVGTTNRTHVKDYARALDAYPDAALLLRVHTSNFRVMGFTKEVELAELVGLARERGVGVMDDLGSGCLIDLSQHGLSHEPVVQTSLREGATVATFSGDKLLGGPQAGLVVGQRGAVERIRSHPFYRAFRPDKLTLAALEATLKIYRDPERAWQALPVLRMLSASVGALEARARRLAAAINASGQAVTASVEPSTSRMGGGSSAIDELPTRVVALRVSGLSVEELSRRLRLGQPSVWTRIHEDRVLIDVRTLLGESEDDEVAAALKQALG